MHLTVGVVDPMGEQLAYVRLNTAVLATKSVLDVPFA